MNYIEVAFVVQPCNQEIIEIMIAELDELGYEGFVETDTGLLAYIKNDKFDIAVLNDSFFLQNSEHNIEVSVSEVQEENWNTVWEQNYFKPVVIGHQCLIRSTFHEITGSYPYEIVIDPKMSFGTGHHETTSLMLEQILNCDMTGKTVLDVGSGTGILAILCAKRNALQVVAVDTDEWAYNNAFENVTLNGVPDIDILQGDITAVGNTYYDIILANINKNIILADIKNYNSRLNLGGLLIVSGFYESDLADIEAEADKYSLKLVKKVEKNNWVAVQFAKPRA